MDTPSSKNGSYLIIAVGIMALVSLIIGIFGLIRAQKVEDRLAQIEGLSARIDVVEGTAKKAAEDSQRASTRATGLSTEIQRAFDTVGTEMNALRTTVNRVQAESKAATDKLAELTSRGGSVSPASSGSGGTTPAGPAPGTLAEDGTYVIKAGDYFAKLAKEWGCSVDDIQRANPGVDSRRLRVGQKIVVPKR